MKKLCYKKLFKKLIDLEMSNSELIKQTDISKSTFYKLKNGDNINTDTIIKICEFLDCDISEIVECVEGV